MWGGSEQGLDGVVGIWDGGPTGGTHGGCKQGLRWGTFKTPGSGYAIVGMGENVRDDDAWKGGAQILTLTRPNRDRFRPNHAAPAKLLPVTPKPSLSPAQIETNSTQILRGRPNLLELVTKASDRVR